MDFSHLCDQLYNILNIIIYKIFKNISRSPSFSRSTESNINVVFNIIIELDKTSNAREHQDEISSSEMKRSTKMSKVCSGHAFHAAQYNFGLGGNWAGITQNVIRYSVVNRRLIVVCSCVLYIYIYEIRCPRNGDTTLLRINRFSIVSYSSRKFLSCLVYTFRQTFIIFDTYGDLNFRFSNSKLYDISTIFETQNAYFFSFYLVILIFYKSHIFNN